MAERDAWKHQSEVIDWLRFPLIVLVVYIHNKGNDILPVKEIDWSFPEGIHFYSWLSYSICEVAARVAVPAFFVISGYFFFLNVMEWNVEVYKAKLKSRVKTLLVPYVLWNIIHLLAPVVWYLAFAWHNPQHIAEMKTYLDGLDWIHLFWDSRAEEGNANWLGIFHQATSPQNFPLWYVRDLMVMVLLTPLTYWLICHLRYYYLLLLLALDLIGLWPNIHGFGITSTLFFSMGAYCGINKINMIQLVRKVEMPNYMISAILLCVRCSPLYDFKFFGVVGLQTFFIISFMISVFCIANRLMSSGRVHLNKKLCESVFFIYVAHAVYFIDQYNQLFVNYFFDIDNIPLAIGFFFTTPWVKIALCIGIYRLMKRYTPKTLGILTGNRAQ